MAQLKVLEECNCLGRTYVPIDFEAHVGYWVSWVDVAYYVLGDDVQAWCLVMEYRRCVLGFQT